MVGRVFSLQKSINRLDAIVDAGPDYLPVSKPFLTGKLNHDEIKEKSSEDLQGLGVELPPYHCSCRHRIVLSMITGDNSPSANSRVNSIKDAEEWAKQNLYLKKVNYSELTLESANDINNTLFNLRKEYRTNLTSVEVLKLDYSTYAQVYGMRAMEFNSQHFSNISKLEKQYLHDIEKKFHPPLRPGVTPLQAITTHEFAHTVFNSNEFTSRIQSAIAEARKIKSAYTRSLKKDFENNFISGYASKNINEFIAESFTMVKTSPKPSSFAVKIVELMDPLFKKEDMI